MPRRVAGSSQRTFTHSLLLLTFDITGILLQLGNWYQYITINKTLYFIWVSLVFPLTSLFSSRDIQCKQWSSPPQSVTVSWSFLIFHDLVSSWIWCNVLQLGCVSCFPHTQTLIVHFCDENYQGKMPFSLHLIGVSHTDFTHQ